MKTFLKPILVLAALAMPVATPVNAWAHAHLLKAEPAVGNSVSKAPDQVVLHFSEGVEPSFTQVIVTDGAGNGVNNGDLSTAPGDKKTLFVPIKPGKPGDYHVEWHATSVDTHKTSGAFVFSVGP
jgi:methionine-rich copper-binding protein CopC